MKLHVRINPKTRAEKFRRCGIAFCQAWQEVEADEALAARLRAEQMLEVSEAVTDTTATADMSIASEAPKTRARKK